MQKRTCAQMEADLLAQVKWGERRERRRIAKERQVEHMHIDIKTKRSWSPVFKQHVYVRRAVNDMQEVW